MNVFEISIIITLMGLSIVFIVLFFLSLITSYYAKSINLMKLLKNRLLSKNSFQRKSSKEQKLNHQIKNDVKENSIVKPKSEEKNNQNYENAELIAVISAAAMYTLETSEKSKYKIKSITSTELNYPYSLWKYAGLAENTASIYFNHGE